MRFKLYTNCIPVKGATRSVICDLQRGKYDFIPNALFEILQNLDGQDKDSVIDRYDPKYQSIIEEYFSFLEAEEYIFYTDQPEAFPNLPLEYETPFECTNAIIDFNDQSNHDINLIIPQLDELGCQAIQIRVYTQKDISFFTDLLQCTQLSKIRSIEILACYDESWLDTEKLNELHKFNHRITRVFIHAAPLEKMDFIDIQEVIPIFFFRSKITDHTHCGVISPEWFSLNITSYTESIFYNSCLNKKISIDVNGNIKNCPSMKSTFGNINNVDLKEVLLNDRFKFLWTIKKDDISVCKDCEFRYICTDCRAYLPSSEIYSKPAKCKYDPYTGTW